MPRSVSAAEIVSHLGAVQAQDYPGALWSIALRTTDATRADVERAVAERAIVRTWPMRGTLHFVPAADAQWMLELLAPRIMKGMAGRQRQMGLDDDVFRRSRRLITRVLTQRTVLSRSALLGALDKGGVSTTGQRGIHILRHLAMERMLCFGPHEEKQPTFVLFDDWIPGSRRLDRDDALRTVAERFFTSHGPASVRDFVWWTGLTLADAKRGLLLARPLLERMATTDGELWMSNQLSAIETPTSRAHLLPGFDELLLGYKDRSATLAPEYTDRICPGGNGVFQATLVLDGRVRGLWRRSMRAKGVQIEASPFVALKASEKKAFVGAAERYARFLGVPVTVSWAAAGN
ncbi:MAG TPA: winged helix DNA-binding domain-containing protein [Gemmatimonadaceae bacterium]